jgi:hypothetical protein
MTPYWLLFFLAAWLASSNLQPVQLTTARMPAVWLAMFVVLGLMIGLRHQVGGDWVTYLEHLTRSRYETLQETLEGGDPAYMLLNWFAAQMDLGVYFVNLVCAGLFTWGLLVFCRAQPLPWLALTVAVPYLITVVAMGYTRQATAIGLAMLGLAALADQKILRFVVFVVLAALFHKTAVILIPLAVLGSAEKRLWSAVWVSISAVLFYELLLQDSVESLRSGYLEAEYASSGAAIRVAMNAVPAALFLLLRKHFDMPQPMRVFWTWMSVGAIGFVGLLVVSSSSTAVDRVALYWIPLQLFVLSRLPDALSRARGTPQAVWVKAVVAYSAAVLFVWLFFAVHAFAWLPYQFYPWVMLWE